MIELIADAQEDRAPDVAQPICQHIKVRIAHPDGNVMLAAVKIDPDLRDKVSMTRRKLAIMRKERGYNRRIQRNLK